MKILNVTAISRSYSPPRNPASSSGQTPADVAMILEGVGEAGAAFLADCFDFDFENDNDSSQDVLSGTGSHSAGLELHFEASQAYKDIIVVQHQRHQRATALKEGGESEEKMENNNGQSLTIDLGLCTQILRGIVQNIEAQDSSKLSFFCSYLLLGGRKYLQP